MTFCGDTDFIFLTSLQIHCVNIHIFVYIGNLIWKKESFFGIKDSEFICLLYTTFPCVICQGVSCDHSIKGCSVFCS